jgi:hypothetical protein
VAVTRVDATKKDEVEQAEEGYRPSVGASMAV